ncbi:unnamed protein product [Rhizophagus irregularis]|nr:unnamed protein product [Rhizophagus irregularis]
MNTSEDFIGQNALISYLSDNNNRTTKSYWRFLKKHRDIIIALIDITFTSTFLDNWKNLDNLWTIRFLRKGKHFPDLKNKFLGSGVLTFVVNIKIIKEYRENLISTEEYNEKENVVPANSSDNDHFISIKNQSISNSSHEIPIKNHSISTENNSKNSQLINFCYDILQELDIKSNIHPFYEISNENIKNSMDLFTIISKLENNQYASIEEFEKDIRLIFRNCYIYNDIGSEMHILGEELESTFNKIWTEKIDFQVKQKENLKRTRNNDTDSSSELVTKQIRILEQNKDKLVYRQVVNDALLIASAYENLVASNILPFIELLKTFLLTRSQISLSSANEPVLQAIVENLLPLKYRIPELSLVMDVGLIKNQKKKFNTNDLENLDKIIEKEDEKILLKRSYEYWSKEHNETKKITIEEILNNGIKQLKSYMNIISKGNSNDYYSSGIFDKRIKITKSNPNKLKGFVILVIGFRRILWKSVEEIIFNYLYEKI